jgi:hypothetical protein
MYICKVAVILVRFEENLKILYTFSRNTEIPNFMKTCPVEADLFLADGHT